MLIISYNHVSKVNNMNDMSFRSSFAYKLCRDNWCMYNISICSYNFAVILDILHDNNFLKQFILKQLNLKKFLLGKVFAIQ